MKSLRRPNLRSSPANPEFSGPLPGIFFPLLLLSSCGPRLEYPRLQGSPARDAQPSEFSIQGAVQAEEKRPRPSFLFLAGPVPGRLDWALASPAGPGEEAELILEVKARKALCLVLEGWDGKGRPCEALRPAQLVLAPGRRRILVHPGDQGLARLVFRAQGPAPEAQLIPLSCRAVTVDEDKVRVFDAGPAGALLPGARTLELPGRAFRDGESLLLGDGLLLEKDEELAWPAGAGAFLAWGEEPGEDIWPGGWPSLSLDEPRSGKDWRALVPERKILLEARAPQSLRFKAGSRLRACLFTKKAGDLPAARAEVLAWNEALSPLPRVLEPELVRPARDWTKSEEEAGLSLRVVATRSDQEPGKSSAGDRPWPLLMARDETQFIPLRAAFLRKARRPRWILEPCRSRDGKTEIASELLWARPWPRGDGAGNLYWAPSVLSPRLPGKVGAGEELEIWVSFHSERGTSPGLYQNSLVILDGGRERGRVSFQVRVAPLTLLREGFPFLAFQTRHPEQARAWPRAEAPNAWVEFPEGESEAKLLFRGGRQKTWGEQARLVPAEDPAFQAALARGRFEKKDPWGWVESGAEAAPLRRRLSGRPVLLLSSRPGTGDRMQAGLFAHLSGLGGTWAGDLGPGPDPWTLRGLPMTWPGPEGPLWTTAGAQALRGWEDRRLLLLLDRAAASARGRKNPALEREIQALRQALFKDIPSSLDLEHGDPDLAYFETMSRARKEAFRLLGSLSGPAPSQTPGRP